MFVFFPEGKGEIKREIRGRVSIFGAQRNEATSVERVQQWVSARRSAKDGGGCRLTVIPLNRAICALIVTDSKWMLYVHCCKLNQIQKVIRISSGFVFLKSSTKYINRL